MKKTLLIFLIFSIQFCKKPNETINKGIITFTKGESSLLRDGVEGKIKKGDLVTKGDKIKTGEKSTVIISFNEGEAQAEIQSNSIFNFNEYTETVADVSLDTGKIWFSVNKKNNKTFKIKNPSAVAGIRGTKIYTMQIDEDTFATCHCEGKVEYSIENSSEKLVNDEDYLVASRNGKSVVIKGDDLMGAIGMKSLSGHKHSELEDSPLGGKATLEEMKIQMLKDFINKKLSE